MEAVEAGARARCWLTLVVVTANDTSRNNIKLPYLTKQLHISVFTTWNINLSQVDTHRASVFAIWRDNVILRIKQAFSNVWCEVTNDTFQTPLILKHVKS